jgi:hypothetical protein
VLGLRAQIDDHSGVSSDEAGILFRASIQSFLRGFEIDEPITFDHVQSLCVRSAELVDHGKWARLDSNAVDRQGIALLMAVSLYEKHDSLSVATFVGLSASFSLDVEPH